MSEKCCAIVETAPHDKHFRRALWIALIVNGAMFGVEVLGGLTADSAALLADALDFFGDAANYALSLFVLGLATVWRSRAALFKGLTMAIYGMLVLARVVWGASVGVVPDASTMGAIGLLALSANVAVALMLYRFRSGDANMRSVWLCSRNDAIANIAVLLAALGVFGTGTPWPDLAVATGIALLAGSSAISVVRHAAAELLHHRAAGQTT